jgi:hypothetical protein
MDWNFEQLFKDIEGRVTGIFEGFSQAAEGASAAADLSSLVTPVDPFNRSSFFTPIIAGAGVLSVVLLAGVAITTFSVTMAAMLAIFFLLTEVFGYELELAPFAAAAAQNRR